MTPQSSQAPLRVLHLISKMSTGGAESLVVQMCRKSEGPGWVCAVASAGGANADVLREAQLAELFTVPQAQRSATGVASPVAATRNAIVAFRPEVILAHNVGVSLIGGIARRSVRRRIPMVSIFHGVAADDYRNSARILSTVPDHVVAVGAVIATRLQDAGLRRRPLTVVPNAVAPPVLMPKDQARSQLGIPPGVPVALCAARIVPQKRHDVLVDAWAEVPQGLLLIAGSGEDQSAIEQRVARLGLGPDRVRFLGTRYDMPRLLSACDLTVLASDWEGLPMATLESLAADRPVVATDVDGLAESVSFGARLVPRRDPSALAGALRELLEDDETRIALGRAGGEEIRRRHDPESMMNTYDRILRAQL